MVVIEISCSRVRSRSHCGAGVSPAHCSPNLMLAGTLALPLWCGPDLMLAGTLALPFS
jgi:hypothetical protein